MGKPVLFVDNDFLIDIYGREEKGIPWGENFNPKLGEAILGDLSKKYEIHITTTVLGEATKEKQFAPIGDWFAAHKSSGEAVIDETPGFAGKDKGERSIVSVMDPGSPTHNPNLPSNPDEIFIATRDQKYFAKTGLKDRTRSTQAVMEEGLKEGTIERLHYDALDSASGDALRDKRGGYRTSQEVLQEHGAATPPAPGTPPVVETQQPATGAAPQKQGQTPSKPAPVPETPPPPVEIKAPPPPPLPPPSAMPEVVLSEAATMGGSKFTTPKTGPNVPAGAHPGVGNAGAASVGLILGVEGLHDAIHRGDKVEGVIAGTNVATSGLQMTESLLSAGGKAVPALKTAGKFVPGLNVAVTTADGLYQISREDTTEHKVERGTVVAATATTGLILGTATASAAEAGVITTGVTTLLGTGAAGVGTAAVVTAAAPVVLTVAAVGAVAYTGEKAIEAKRAWDDVDKQIADGGAAQKRQNYRSQDGKPSVLGFKHIAVALMHHSEGMKNENMNGTAGLERDANGRFKIQDFKKIDMRDPKNIAELERVLKASLEKQDKILADNHNMLDNVLPKWMAHGSGTLDKITMAQMEKADLTGAMQELQMYRKELSDYDAAHPKDPATTQPARPKMAKGPGSP